jgi:hypothetical protein
MDDKHNTYPKIDLSLQRNRHRSCSKSHPGRPDGGPEGMGREAGAEERTMHHYRPRGLICAVTKSGACTIVFSTIKFEFARGGRSRPIIVIT